MLRNLLINILSRRRQSLCAYSSGSGRQRQPPPPHHNVDVPVIDYDDPDFLPLPQYTRRPEESLQLRKQRLLYQSRKRGMLENDLLLSTFAAKYLKEINEELTEQYDQLINGVSNDWDIYYWATNTKPVPPQYDNAIMRMLKSHVANDQREKRLRQPDLY